MNKLIFKSYDVRGIYPTELNEEIAYKIGKAFVEFTGSKKIVLGYDSRISGPDLLKSLREGMISCGADVCNIGQVPTEVIYFALDNYDFNGAIMVTASHNPKEYNGFKMIKKSGKDMEIIRGVDLLSEIEKNSNYKETDNGQFFEKDVWQDYINYVLKFSEKTKEFKIVVDASNGVGGLAILKIQDKLSIKIIHLNSEPDGNFPNHSPNPLSEGSIDQIENTIKLKKADFGFMFDADADRIFLVDENGKLVAADLVLLLLAKYFLAIYPGAPIIYNAVCSKAVSEFVKKWGGNPIRTKVGSVNVRDGLLENNGVIGGEVSAHYSFRDYSYMDSGIIAFLIILKIISDDGRKVSEIIKELSIYFKTDTNFEVKNKEEVMEKIKQEYSNGKQDFLDGITVEYEDWWFNVRPSNTEPLLRLTIEANTQKLLDEKKEGIKNFILKIN